MRVRNLIASISTVSTVFSNEVFFVTNDKTVTCFPITERSIIRTEITRYNDKDVQSDFTEEIDLKSPPMVHLMGYRRNKIGKSYKVSGENYAMEICVAEAAELGYCEENGFYESEDNTPLFNGTYYVGNETLESWAKPIGPGEVVVEESGYYCVRSFSRFAKSYNVEIAIDDGNTLTRASRRHLFTTSVALLLEIIMVTGLLMPWLGKSTLPFSVKWLALNGVESILLLTIKVTYIWKHYESLLFPTLMNILNSSSDLWLNLFMFYQYSGKFAHEEITEYSGMKMVAILQCYQLINLVMDRFEIFTGKSIEEAIGGPRAVSIIRLILNLINCATWSSIHPSMFTRYRQTVKTYTDSNKSNHPILRQFQLLFLYKYVFAGVIMKILEFILKLLEEIGAFANFYFYRDCFMVDDDLIIKDQFTALITLFLKISVQIYMNWVYWRPHYFEKVKGYKERHD